MHARQKGPEPSSVYTQKGAMMDVLARCLKKTDVQVCTLTSVYILLCNCRYSHSCYIRTFLWPTIAVPLCVQARDCINNRFIFRRLKINHDTPEFILDSGTVANKVNISIERSLKTYVGASINDKRREGDPLPSKRELIIFYSILWGRHVSFPSKHLS